MLLSWKGGRGAGEANGAMLMSEIAGQMWWREGAAAVWLLGDASMGRRGGCGVVARHRTEWLGEEAKWRTAGMMVGEMVA